MNCATRHMTSQHSFASLKARVIFLTERFTVDHAYSRKKPALMHACGSVNPFVKTPHARNTPAFTAVPFALRLAGFVMLISSRYLDIQWGAMR